MDLPTKETKRCALADDWRDVECACYMKKHNQILVRFLDSHFYLQLYNILPFPASLRATCRRSVPQVLGPFRSPAPDVVQMRGAEVHPREGGNVVQSVSRGRDGLHLSGSEHTKRLLFV